MRKVKYHLKSNREEVRPSNTVMLRQKLNLPKTLLSEQPDVNLQVEAHLRRDA